MVITFLTSSSGRSFRRKVLKTSIGLGFGPIRYSRICHIFAFSLVYTRINQFDENVVVLFISYFITLFCPENSSFSRIGNISFVF